MERIQSAIEKARAAREAARDAAGSAPGAAAPAAAPAEVLSAGRAESSPAPVNPAQEVEAAWAALSPLAPDTRLLREKRVVAMTGGQESVPFDVLRTKVLQQMRSHGWRRLAITSPSPACGKSTIALNLALSLARQPELRVILVELDLRRPSLSAMLGVRGRKGFSQVLEERADFAEVAQRHGTGLALALNEGSVRNPAELLHGRNVGSVLERIEARYAPDIMIFDMPPLLVSDDTMAFMHHVDAALLIAGAETTTIKEIDSCERELASQTNVMGVILNKCQFMGQEYGYGYYG